MNVVEKYGGTSVGTIAQIKAIAAHAAKLKAQGDQVVIVASAMGKTTNKLIAMAKEIGEHVNAFHWGTENHHPACDGH